jgi:hypothetical protein
VQPLDLAGGREVMRGRSGTPFRLSISPKRIQPHPAVWLDIGSDTGHAHDLA